MFDPADHGSELWNNSPGELSCVRVGVIIMACLESSCF